MPLLFYRHPAEAVSFAMWQIVEDEAYFRADLPLSTEEEAELALLKNMRRLEWLAGRYLLHKLTGAPKRMPLAKDAFSKPFFLDAPALHCSLSHSHGIVGALLAPRSCGCDVQVMVEKTARLAPKFLNTTESDFVYSHNAAAQFDLVHIYWTAKESLYKAWGLKELDFRAHMRLDHFVWENNTGTTTGHIEKEGQSATYRLFFEKNELPEEGGTYIWTFCLMEETLRR